MPDPRTGYVYSISERKEGGQEIAACNVRNFQFIGTIPLGTGTKGGAGNPLRWGDDGFAYSGWNTRVSLSVAGINAAPTVSTIPTT